MRRRKGFTLDGQPYADYIRSPAWAEVKRRYRASKLPQKCACGHPGWVDLHHRTYKRLGREWLRDLVPLCRSCHERLHAQRRRRLSHRRRKIKR